MEVLSGIDKVFLCDIWCEGFRYTFLFFKTNRMIWQQVFCEHLNKDWAILSTKDLLAVTTFYWEPKHLGGESCFLQIFWNFTFGPWIESPGISTVIVHTKAVEIWQQQWKLATNFAVKIDDNL